MYICRTKTKTWRFGPLEPRVCRGEVLPVPPEMLPKAWPDGRRLMRRVPGYDVQRLYHRLLLGHYKLWLAIRTAGFYSQPGSPILGVIVTAVTASPPSTRQCFQRADPAARRSLTVHLAEGKALEAWIQSAVERISAYGREQNCRQLFLMARKGWREYVLRFYSPNWDTVAYSRDRPTQAQGIYRMRNRVGFYRRVIPVREIRRQSYNTGTLCYMKEGA
jgi:hypothetical protein